MLKNGRTIRRERKFSEGFKIKTVIQKAENGAKITIKPKLGHKPSHRNIKTHL